MPEHHPQEAPTLIHRDGQIVAVRTADGGTLGVAEAVRRGELVGTSLTGIPGGRPGRPLSDDELRQR